MTMLIGQMLGCLFVAAGIGGITGWLLRHLSISKLNQHISDLTRTLQINEQTLHSAHNELKAKASTIQSYESKLTLSDTLARSVQQELVSCTERLHAAQEELRSATRRLSTMESEHQASLQRYHDSDATLATYAEEARLANAGRTEAQQALSAREGELLDLQNRLTEAERNLAELERRAQEAERQPAQGRVHWLEVQLSEKDTQQRAALHERETQHAAQLATIQEVHATLAERDRELLEKEQRITALQRQYDELHALHVDMAEKSPTIGKKKKEASPLQKLPTEVRTALTRRPEDKPDSAQALEQTETQLHVQMSEPKPIHEPQKDDLEVGG